jgi:hypothetical protein
VQLRVDGQQGVDGIASINARPQENKVLAVNNTIYAGYRETQTDGKHAVDANSSQIIHLTRVLTTANLHESTFKLSSA